MNNALSAHAANDQSKLSRDLEILIGRWERIQTELERVAHIEATSIDVATQHRDALNELEEQLVAQESQVLHAIMRFECQSLQDIHAKLQLWKRIVAPEGAVLSSMSLPEQIALSALKDLER